MIKSILKIALLSFLWAASLYWTAAHFFKQGAYYGYDVAANECGLDALQEIFKEKQ